MTRRNPILLPFLFPSLAMASLPLVDFDRMGTVGLAGSFAGLDLFANTSVSFDPSTSSLLTRNNDGALTLLGSTNTGGSIAAACSSGDTIYFAGSFSSIGGVSAQNVASYSYSSSSFSSLGSNGPNGNVAAVYCDASHNRLWVGGQFTSPAPSVAVWDTKASSWSAAPFGGLSGAGGEVLSITTNASQSSLIFAGSFVTAFGNGSRVINGTNNPNVPFSSGATPFSSSLVPVPLTGDKTQIDAAPSSTQNGFNDINAILCPAGADGPGNTWLAQDGNQAVITVRKFTFLAANGIRIGNTFVNGRGTTGFKVATIPDNAVRTLQYVDPITGQNQTCSTDCPLLSDPSVPYQDFLFTDGSPDITGFQLTLSEWKGSGPGLHLLQLLSPGAFASSVASQNGQSCFAPSASNATRTGTWTEKDVITKIPGTVQPVLVASVDVGTPSTQAPTFTWMPYVSASGVYAVNLLIPGCTILQDCALRTSVKVTVFPGGGQPPFVSTISQANPDDQSVNLYTGPVVPTSESFSMTVTMALADAPEGKGQNGKYELVADRVQLTLQSANLTSSGSPGGTNGTSVGSQTGFGLFEWPLDGQQGVNASGVLPNSSLTILDAAGFSLLSALGTGNAQASSVINTVVQAPSGTLFIGGRFALTSGPATGASNVVMFKDGALAALSNNGLDGMVTSLALHDNTLFIGGSFSDTANPTTNGKLRGVAAYDVQANQWASLDGGLAGTVASITLADPGTLLAAGNFSAAADGKSEDGLAAWNISGQNWANSGGFLKGQLSLVSNATVSSKGASVEQVVAGNVATSLRFGASGFALLQNNGDNDEPKITPIGVDLQNPLSTNSTSSTNARRHLRRAQGSMSWFHRVGSIFKRQTPAVAQLAPLPSPASTSGPAVLAGAYWTNTSTSRQIVILGGNFEFTTTSGRTSQNIAFYDPQTTTIEALNGNQLNGTVRSLLVVDDDLYIGGTFTVQGTEFTGFAIYNLARGEWDTVGSQPVRAASGDVVVRSITVSPSQENTIIVAGTFTQVGDTTCRAICEYDTKQRKWNALGNGIQGEAATVSYAGDKRDTIIVAGSLALADGTVANVAQFAIANSSWTGVGGSNALPGPVTAMEVNNGNASSIFAAGKSSDGSFLSFWNGQTWTAVNSGFAGTTDVAQLTMVPLQNTHAANGVIEPDRMLWISGALSDPSFGSASSALFDGENIIPYVMTADPSGNPGVVASLFHSFSTFSFTQRHFLAVGIVILISIAIAAGVVFLLALIGILWTLFARKDDKTDKFDPAEIDDDDSMTHRPSSLLEHINAATRTTIIGQSPFGEPSSEKGAEAAAAAAASADPFGPDASNFARAETPSDAIGGILAGEEVSRPAHARYSFDGKSEGELPMSAGQEIEILDDGDAAWWYARDTRTGKEGVVPAAYVY